MRKVPSISGYELHIYIEDGKGEDASFFNKKVTITLHFKRFPFVL